MAAVLGILAIVIIASMLSDELVEAFVIIFIGLILMGACSKGDDEVVVDPTEATYEELMEANQPIKDAIKTKQQEISTQAILTEGIVKERELEEVVESVPSDEAWDYKPKKRMERRY